MIAFRRILWVKSIALEDDLLAYGGKDASVRFKEPRYHGDVFPLHSTPDDAESLAEPEVDDLMVLIQHGYVTHLVKVVGGKVVPRPKRSIRSGTRDRRFSVQRDCSLIILRDFDEAPTLEAAFGFEPEATGGEVFRISDLPAYETSDQPMWLVQRRIIHAMNPPLKYVPPSFQPEDPPRPLEPGPGRVRRQPKSQT